MKKHIHHDVISAWVEGKVVQVQSPEGRWLPLAPLDSNMHVTPAFVADCNYRIKPEDPFAPLTELFIGQSSCPTGSCGFLRVPREDAGASVSTDKSEAELVADIVKGIEAHKLADNERGL